MLFVVLRVFNTRGGTQSFWNYTWNPRTPTNITATVVDLCAAYNYPLLYIDPQPCKSCSERHRAVPAVAVLLVESLSYQAKTGLPGENRIDACDFALLVLRLQSQRLEYSLRVALFVCAERQKCLRTEKCLLVLYPSVEVEACSIEIDVFCLPDFGPDNEQTVRPGTPIYSIQYQLMPKLLWLSSWIRGHGTPRHLQRLSSVNRFAFFLTTTM
jgi:hypothetical protein